MKSNKLSYILIIILFWGCKSGLDQDQNKKFSQKDSKHAPMIIDIARDFENEREFRLSEIAYDIEYIQLESTPESLIGGGVRRLIITVDYIYIYNQRRLLQFDKTGKFIKQIGREGRGPGELQVARNLAIDKNNKIVYMLANFKNEVLKYDASTGEFLGSFPRSEYLGNIVAEGSFQVISNGILSSLSHFMTQYCPEYILLEIFDDDGNILKKLRSHLFSYLDDEKIAKQHWVAPNGTWIFDGQLRVFEGVNDTIYNLVDLELEPAFIFKLGKYKGPFDVMVNFWYDNTRRNRYISFDYFRETSSFLFIRYRYNGELLIGKYNKEEGQFTRLKNPKGEGNRLYNDIDGGVSIWPYYNDGEMGNKWYYLIDAINMKQKLTPEYLETSEAVFPKKKVKLKEFLADLSMENNPVLMIVYLK